MQTLQDTSTEERVGPMRWIRSVPTAARHLLIRQTHCTPDLLGLSLSMSDGRHYTPFRHTRRNEEEWSKREPPAVLQPRFHLTVLSARPRRLHALFRVVCIVTTPFFVGLRGFRSKLWMV